MFTSALSAALLLATAAQAQYGNMGSSYAASAHSSSATASAVAAAASSMPSGETMVQVISVSDNNGSLNYFPNDVQAPIGSIVQFQFHPKNHTVSESSFAAPCSKLASNLTSATHPGQHSGFVPTTGTETFPSVYNVLINDTKPIWIYCGQTNHCQKGMSMVINQNRSDTVKTLENYKLAAAALALTSTASAAGTTATSMAGGGGASSMMMMSSMTMSSMMSESTAAPVFGGGAASTVTSMMYSSSTVAQAGQNTGGPSIVMPQTASGTGSQPSTFTGAAVKVGAREMGVLGALVAGLAVL